MPRPVLASLLLVSLCWGGGALAQPTIHPDLRVRGGYFGVEGPQRDGTHRSDHTLQARVQAGLGVGFAEGLRLDARLATRVSTEQGAFHVRAPDYMPGAAGAAPGDVVLDRLALTWSGGGGVWARVGRFQTEFALPGVPSKSLIRQDGPSIDVHWTDGVHLRTDIEGGGRLHLIAIHTPPSGVATPLRPPLRFEDGVGRFGYFASWEGREVLGPLTHRALEVLFHPRAVPDEEDDLGAFVVVGARGALTFPAPQGHYLVAGEAGYTLTSPTRAAVRVPGPGDAGPAAAQVTFNWMGFGGGAHDVGVMLGAAGSGWLVSGDFRPNTFEQEARYYWRFAPRMRLDVRVRRRQDLVAPIGAMRRRDEVDGFVRLNYRLGS